MNINLGSLLEVLNLDLDASIGPLGQVIPLARVSFGAGPGGGDYREYLLEHNGDRTNWALWLVADDPWSDDAEEQKTLYGLQARMVTASQISVEDVALNLLKASWSEEFAKGTYETDFEALKLEFSTLFSEKDLQALAPN